MPRIAPDVLAAIARGTPVTPTAETTTPVTSAAPTLPVIPLSNADRLQMAAQLLIEVVASDVPYADEILTNLQNIITTLSTLARQERQGQLYRPTTEVTPLTSPTPTTLTPPATPVTTTPAAEEELPLETEELRRRRGRRR
jgi:hypothetical protein